MMLRKWLLITSIAVTGCTSVTQYEAEIYKDGFITKDSKSVYVLKQRMLNTSSYFYAIFDNYSETDSLISAQIQKLDLDGNVEKEIELNIKTRGFENWNDSVTILRDTAGSLIKVNLISGEISRIQRHEDHNLILGSTGETYYTFHYENQSVSIFKKSLHDNHTDFNSTIIRFTPMYDSMGYPQFTSTTGFNHLVGNNTLCLYTSDSIYLCDVGPWNVVRLAGISGCTTVLPLTANRFICSTGSSAGVYSHDGTTLTLVESIPVTEFKNTVTDSSGVNAIRVEYDDYDINKTNRIVLLNLRSGNESDLCIGSKDTL